MGDSRLHVNIKNTWIRELSRRTRTSQLGSPFLSVLIICHYKGLSLNEISNYS